MKSSRIKDTATREVVSNLERKVDKIQSIPQLPRTASLASVIDAINKLTDSMKRS